MGRSKWVELSIIGISSMVKMVIISFLRLDISASDVGISFIIDIMIVIYICSKKKSHLSFVYFLTLFSWLFMLRFNNIALSTLSVLTTSLLINQYDKQSSIKYRLVLPLLIGVAAYYLNMDAIVIAYPLIHFLCREKKEIKYIPIVVICISIAFSSVVMQITGTILDNRVVSMFSFTIVYTHILYGLLCLNHDKALRINIVTLNYYSKSLATIVILSDLLFCISLFAQELSFLKYICLILILSQVIIVSIGELSLTRQNEEKYHLGQTLDVFFAQQLVNTVEEGNDKHFFVGLSEKIKDYTGLSQFELVERDNVVYSYGMNKTNQLYHYIGEDSQLSMRICDDDYARLSMKEFKKVMELIQYLNMVNTVKNKINMYASTKDTQGYHMHVALRKDISYYLHDSILQDLLAAKNIISTIDTTQEATKQLVVETLETMNVSIRNQMFEIYPSTLEDLSFDKNINMLIREVEDKYPLGVKTLLFYDVDEHLSDVEKYFVYQTLKELLINAYKHADADCIQVRVYNDEGFVLEVEDNGKTMDYGLDSVDGMRHLGFQRIVSEAKSIGAHFDYVKLTKGKKFTIRIGGKV